MNTNKLSILNEKKEANDYENNKIKKDSTWRDSVLDKKELNVKERLGNVWRDVLSGAKYEFSTSACQDIENLFNNEPMRFEDVRVKEDYNTAKVGDFFAPVKVKLPKNKCLVDIERRENNINHPHVQVIEETVNCAGKDKELYDALNRMDEDNDLTEWDKKVEAHVLNIMGMNPEIEKSKLRVQSKHKPLFEPVGLGLHLNAIGDKVNETNRDRFEFKEEKEKTSLPNLYIEKRVNEVFVKKKVFFSGSEFNLLLVNDAEKAREAMATMFCETKQEMEEIGANGLQVLGNPSYHEVEIENKMRIISERNYDCEFITKTVEIGDLPGKGKSFRIINADCDILDCSEVWNSAMLTRWLEKGSTSENLKEIYLNPDDILKRDGVTIFNKLRDIDDNGDTSFKMLRGMLLIMHFELFDVNYKMNLHAHNVDIMPINQTVHIIKQIRTEGAECSYCDDWEDSEYLLFCDLIINGAIASDFGLEVSTFQQILEERFIPGCRTFIRGNDEGGQVDFTSEEIKRLLNNGPKMLSYFIRYARSVNKGFLVTVMRRAAITMFLLQDNAQFPLIRNRTYHEVFPSLYMVTNICDEGEVANFDKEFVDIGMVTAVCETVTMLLMTMVKISSQTISDGVLTGGNVLPDKMFECGDLVQMVIACLDKEKVFKNGLKDKRLQALSIMTNNVLSYCALIDERNIFSQSLCKFRGEELVDEMLRCVFSRRAIDGIKMSLVHGFLIGGATSLVCKGKCLDIDYTKLARSKLSMSRLSMLSTYDDNYLKVPYFTGKIISEVESSGATNLSMKTKKKPGPYRLSEFEVDVNFKKNKQLEKENELLKKKLSELRRIGIVDNANEKVEELDEIVRDKKDSESDDNSSIESTLTEDSSSKSDDVILEDDNAYIRIQRKKKKDKKKKRRKKEKKEREEKAKIEAEKRKKKALNKKKKEKAEKKKIVKGKGKAITILKKPIKAEKESGWDQKRRRVSDRKKRTEVRYIIAAAQGSNMGITSNREIICPLLDIKKVSRLGEIRNYRNTVLLWTGSPLLPKVDGIIGCTSRCRQQEWSNRGILIVRKHNFTYKHIKKKKSDADFDRIAKERLDDQRRRRDRFNG